MAETYLKAVEFSKTSAKWRRTHGQTLTELLHTNPERWQWQPKYDGCYANMTIRERREDCQALSRTGEDYSASCGHLLDELHKRAKGKECVVLGEVYIWGTPFPEISGAFRRQSPSRLSLMAHDLLPLSRVSNESYRDRRGALSDLLLCPNGQVHTVPTQALHPKLTIEQTASKMVACGGYDGVIVRDMNSAYSWGKADEGQIVKVKPNVTLDLKCSATCLEVGPKTGRNVLTLAVEYRGVTSWVGSGIPHSMKPEDALDKIIEVACMGITDEGRLREPRFKGIRFDKEQADT